MITNLYAKYLLADRLNKVAEAAGVEVYTTTFHNGGKYDEDVQVQIMSSGKRRDGESENVAERNAIRLLDAKPDLSLVRSSGLIHLTGMEPNGLSYSFYTGTGSCERVQVGTRTLPAEAAKPEREEPIYEVRCIDDLAGLVTA